MTSRYDFIHDVELIYKNSLQFNGETSEYSMKAKKLLDTTQQTLDTFADHLEVLEQKIREVQQRAIEQVYFSDLSLFGQKLQPEDEIKLGSIRCKHIFCSTYYLALGVDTICICHIH